MSLKATINEEMNKDLANMSAQDVINAYISNLLGSLILLRTGDSQIVKILKDSSNKNLSSIKTDSPINYWGYLLFKSKNKTSKDLLPSNVAKELSKLSSRVTTQTYKGIHAPLSTRPLFVDWGDLMIFVKSLFERFQIHDRRLLAACDVLENWDTSAPSDKSQAAQRVYFLLNRSDKESVILDRIRNSLNKISLNANKEDDVVRKVKRIKEDADASVTTTSSASIASKDFRLLGNKVVRRKRRNAKYQPSKLTKIRSKLKGK